MVKISKIRGQDPWQGMRSFGALRVLQARVRTPPGTRARSRSMAGASSRSRKVLVVEAFCGLGEGGRAMPFTGNPAGVVLEDGDGGAGKDRSSGTHALNLALRFPGILNRRGGDNLRPRIRGAFGRAAPAHRPGDAALGNGLCSSPPGRRLRAAVVLSDQRGVTCLQKSSVPTIPIDPESPCSPD